MIDFKKTSIGLAITAVALLTVFYYLNKEDPMPPVQQAVDTAPAKATPGEPVPTVSPEPAPAAAQQVPRPESGEPGVEVAVEEAEPDEMPEPAGIDPMRLAEAELALVNNQIYEEVARDTLPTLSIQTNNPIWVLEYEAEHREDGKDPAPTDYSGPLPAPESGPFGNIQPPEGEIWLRIPAEYADEHLDIMAENADLYRAETGYSDPVTITLWVGGRPYARQQYN